ncbi:MAG: aminopeptidase P family protein [Clostridia bacterium]|nr:aminopeptidase P family protein [Clostridia bacterium]
MKTEITSLRERMQAAGVDVYIIPTGDFHGSEYVGGYFKCRSYVSGFTGSAGTLAVTADDARLWTDGRYFLQAADQLAGSGITLMKAREPGVPSIEEWLGETLKAGQTLGFDGRTMTAFLGKRYEEAAKKRDAKVRFDIDLVGEIWEGRPAPSDAPVWALGGELSGKSRKEKLGDLRKAVKDAGADCHILASLADVAWLMNLRGDDVKCSPVFLSFFMLDGEKSVLYIDENKLSEEIKASLAADGVELRPYLSVFADAAALSEDRKVMLDPNSVSFALLNCVKGEKIERDDPTLLPKSMKNETERKNAIEAHVKDGAALVRFIKWIKENVGKEPITEISGAEKLESFRKARPGYLGPSFEPIFGYGPHGAIIHYSATEETNADILPEGLLLFDTGSQFLEGTTDVTRTIAVGPVTDEMKRDFTTVLRGHLRLLGVRFKKGCSGVSLDVLARGPLWERGLDYNHGTGHGVGSLLNVHEGPQSINYYSFRKPQPLEEGMITSDEPGFYLAGKYGIRHESLLLCEKDEENEYGTFLRFRALTMCPFDLDALLPDEMTAEEKAILNAYHATVYETLSPLLTDDEKAWLKDATRPV